MSMGTRSRLYSRTLLGVAIAALGAGAAVAADDAPDPAAGVERDYVFDISGAPARTGLTGECVYTRVYSAEGVRPSCLNESAAQEAAPAVADTSTAAAPPSSATQRSDAADQAVAPAPEDSAAQAGAMSPPPQRDMEEAERAGAEAEAAAVRAAEEAAARAAAQDEAARVAAEAAAAEQAERAREATPAAPPPPADVARPEEALPAPTRPAVTERTPAIKTVSLDTQTLFAFDRAVITPAGRRELDAFVAELMDLEYGTIHVTGHADRIGSDAYNVELSRDRAEAVRRYLAERGIDVQKIQARGVGSSEPVTQAGACQGLKRTSLIDCLHPDRRVEVEVVAQREE